MIKEKYRVVAMTTLCADIFDATGEIWPGGEALNFGMHACKYDYINLAIIGAIGDDEVGKKILSVIKEKPIDDKNVHTMEGATTASNRIYTDINGDRFFRQDSWNGGIYQTYELSDDDKRIVSDADVVFINYYSPSFRDVVALKKNHSFKLAVDFDVVRDWKTMESYFQYIDFFLISGEEEFLNRFEQYSEQYECIFNITLGAKGSVSYHNGREYRINAIPIEHVVDTTGCGDSYHAGFICSYIKYSDIRRAMLEGSAVAASNLKHFGGFLR